MKGRPIDWRVPPASEFRFKMQRFEFLAPQPASQSLTHTELGRARNATKWRRFVHKDLLA